MGIAVFSVGMSVPSMVDWLEFKVLSNEYGLYRLNDLRALIEELQDQEAKAVAELDNWVSGVIEKITNEISFRSKTLDFAYPFTIEDDGKTLQLSDNASPGGQVYLYCLIFSHIVRKDVLELSPPSENADRDIMQICSTLAAAAVAGGNAVSFGWPRPDSSGFLTALRRAYALFGEGTQIVDAPIPGSSPWVKDAGIDVIAWGNVVDGSAGKPYYLGQVASGDNWEGKPIRSDIAQFHAFFVSMPASMHTEAMFVPNCTEPQTTESYDERLTWLTRKYGSIYNRYRLPRYAEEGYDLATQHDPQRHIERHEHFEQVVEYVENFKNMLQDAA